MPPYVSPEAKDLMRKLLKVCVIIYYRFVLFRVHICYMVNNIV